MKNVVLLVGILASILSIVFHSPQSAHSYASGAPIESTGAPGEGTCITCHNAGGFPREIDFFEISAVNEPLEYQAGETYSFEVEASSFPTLIHGFELTATEGTLVVTDASNTQLIGSGNYITHTTEGSSSSFGTSIWAFDWQAPENFNGNVTFYAAGNISDGDGTSYGDVIMTDTYDFNVVTGGPCSGFYINIENSYESEVGASDASANVVITSGVAPYTYSWSTGATTSSISNLTTGNYTVEVTDSEGCSVIQEFQISLDPMEYTIDELSSITSCGGTLTDSGSETGNYQNNEDYTVTIYPNQPGQSVELYFEMFVLEAAYDFLKIYDGETTMSPLLISATDTDLNGESISASENNMSGALTLRFTSDVSNVTAGWKAFITCVEMNTVLGCTDNDALNYDEDATQDDGSCIYVIIEGCTDNQALNYNPEANQDDGTCTYPPMEGCTDPNYVEFNPDANIDDGSCETFAIFGCVIEEACNYNIQANVNDGSCYFVFAHIFDYTFENPVLNVTTNADVPVYTWYLNGVLLPETNSQFTPEQNGEYQVIVSDSELCTASASMIVSNLTLEEVEDELLNVFYLDVLGRKSVNPEIGSLYIKVSEYISGKTVKEKILYNKK